MLKVVAICGKGGVGKTTVSSLIAKALFQKRDRKALIIDADPAGGLGMALGIKPRRSLSDIKNEMIGSIKKGKSDKKDIAFMGDYLIMESLTELGNLAFLSIGRPEERGCYCSINNLLRDSLKALAEKFELTLIDGEAGIEQVNRMVMRAVQFLILVSDPTVKGIQVAQAIQKVARKISPRTKAGLLLNKIRSEEELKQIRAQTKLNIIGWAPEDDTIREFDANAFSFFQLPTCPAYKGVIKALEKLKIL